MYKTLALLGVLRVFASLRENFLLLIYGDTRI